MPYYAKLLYCRAQIKVRNVIHNFLPGGKKYTYFSVVFVSQSSYVRCFIALFSSFLEVDMKRLFRLYKERSYFWLITLCMPFFVFVSVFNFISIICQVSLIFVPSLFTYERKVSMSFRCYHFLNLLFLNFFFR